MTDPKVYSVEEVAKILGVSRNGMYRAIERGEIPSVRVGRRIVVPMAAVERLLEQSGDVAAA